MTGSYENPMLGLTSEITLAIDRSVILSIRLKTAYTVNQYKQIILARFQTCSSIPTHLPAENLGFEPVHLT